MNKDLERLTEENLVLRGVESELEQQIKELQEMCKECDIKYEELWASNWKLKAVIDDIKEWSDSYSSGYDQYDYEKAKHHELKEILKKVESK